MMKLIKQYKIIAAALFMMATLLSPALFTATTAVAQGAAGDAVLEGAGATGQEGGAEVEDSVSTVTNVLLFLLGIVAVIAIVIGGIMYAASAGDPGKAKAAKDTILYAVIGLIVAILAYAIVNFVIGSFTN